ncbi:SurA N-terminal domain-containing protein [Arenimonas sp.]|uniref:SurA N-terminal domain-containing protein n=1 Tax=Arenimonas sp. TaxID=1872635 RepID=UPI0039E5BA1E
MLQSIREKTSGWIATIILGLIILTMAFFGIETYLTPDVENYAARIEGPAKFLSFGKQTKDVGTNEFRARFDAMRARERQSQGENFNAAEFETVENKRRILDMLIDEALLAMVAERDGIVVPDSVVQKEIMGIESFQTNGKFDATQYQLALQMQQPPVTPQQFQQQVREGLQKELLPRQISESAVAGEKELAEFIRLSGQKRDARALEVPVATIPPMPPTDAEIKAWYDGHAAKYRSEESVAIEYVELDAANVAVDVVADEKALLARYESEKSRFGGSEERYVAHILVKVDPKAPASAWDAAQAKARDIASKARLPGADFAALARQYSDDLGSKDGGGDLGLVQKDTFGQAFDKAVFGMQQGQVSDPVRMPEGWSVIQLRELKSTGAGKSFAEVRAQLESEYLEGERERRFNEISGKLVDAVYANPESLATAAKSVGLSVQRTGSFTSNRGDGIAALEPVRKAAFADEQKNERQVSDPVEISPNHIVVLHVIEHKPSAATPLAQVRDRVIGDVNADRIAKATKANAEALLARLKKGESMDALAAELGGKVFEMPGLMRQAAATQLPPALVAEVFRVAAPKGDQLDAGMAKYAPDRYALITVTKVTDGNVSELDAATRARVLEQFAQARGLVDLRAYVKSLRKQYTIKVAEDRL